MSIPIYQHLVPRCYLKNFSNRRKKKDFFVDVAHCDREKNILIDLKIYSQNIKRICGENHFYNFDLPEVEDRVWLETWFGVLESKFTPIYEKLVDEGLSSMSADDKNYLLMFVIAQRLRVKTNHIAINSISDRIIDFVYKAHEQLGTTKDITSENGETWSFEGKDQEQAIKDSNNSNRQMVNIESFRRIDDLVLKKWDYRVVVFENRTSSGFISSDNPVHISNNLIFDPEASWRMPLDQNHLLVLYPESRLKEINNLAIVRSPIQEISIDLYNSAQIGNRFGCIYGHEKDIERAIKIYGNFNKHNDLETM